MADHQLENGFVRIAHSLLQGILRSDLTLSETRVALAILDLTYGANGSPKVRQVPSPELAAASGLSHANARKALVSLRAKGLVRYIQAGARRPPFVGIEKSAFPYASPGKRGDSPTLPTGSDGSFPREASHASPGKHAKRDKREETSLSERARRAARLLSKEAGTWDEKVAWVERELDRLGAEVEASFRDEPTPRQRSAKFRSLIIRWWRADQVREKRGKRGKYPQQRSMDDAVERVVQRFADHARAAGHGRGETQG